MYSTFDLIAACVVTAVCTHAIYLAPLWRDSRRARREQQRGIGGRHDGPCSPEAGDQT